MDWAINLKDSMDGKVRSPQMETRPCLQPTIHLRSLPLGHCWFHALFSHQSHPAVALMVSFTQSAQPENSSRLGREGTRNGMTLNTPAECRWARCCGSVELSPLCREGREVWVLEGTMMASEHQPSGFVVMPAVWAFCTLFFHQNAYLGLIEKVPSIQFLKHIYAS